MLTRILLRTAAVVGPHLIHTHTTILTGRRQLGTFVDILLAGFTMEGRWASTNECGVKSRTLATVGTRVGGTGIGNVAHFTRPARWTAASVRGKGYEVTCSSIATWRTHACVVGGC